MTAKRLSRLQRRILTRLVADDQRTRGTMSASHEDLVRALAYDKGNLSTRLKDLMTITPSPGGPVEEVDLTGERRNRVASLTARCKYGYLLINIHLINYPDVAAEG